MLDHIAPFVRAGFAIHWLAPRTKRPFADNWSELPVATLEALRATYRDGNNVGVRLGEPSIVGDGYLHVLDVDIRVPELADEAMERLRTLFPGVDTFPSVISGSGGASRHYYFITDKPFRSRRLAVAESKFRRHDASRGKDVWSNEWEIELFGSGKQVVMPPSIHPDSGKPYIWERPVDFTALELGFGPFVSSDAVEALGAAEDTVYQFETVEPLTFTPGQMERDLDVINVSALHYDDWILLGQAIHHQTGGSAEGFDLWLEHTKRSAKFEGEKQIREMRRSKWRSFGKYRGRPATMATVRQWAQEARSAAMMAELDDLTDLDDDDEDDALSGVSGQNFEDVLGGEGDSLSASDEFDAADAKAPPATSPELEWKSLLEWTDSDAPVLKGTLHNLELILKNDERFIGLPQLNEFTMETVQRTTPGTKANRRKKASKSTRQLDGQVWNVEDTKNGELWSDDRDFAIRSVIEAPKTQGGYSLKVTDRDLKAAIVLAADASRFHPVREFLDGSVWDGVPRAEGLFIDYVGAPDDSYHRHVSRLWLVGAVSRIFEPGHKFDFAPILEGLQGKRKSTFIETLGKSWFAELDGDFHDTKGMVELMQGAWIMEIPELSGFQRADVRAIKAFISRKKDRARLAYARRAGEFPRQLVFMGSTNDREYLKDDTGGRRFWPVECQLPNNVEIDIERLALNVDQIWAEAAHLYREMRKVQPRGTLPLYLADDEARVMAVRLQESRRMENSDDVLAGRIADWLDKPIISGSIDDDHDEQGNRRVRKVTCTAEVWVELLLGDARAFRGPEQSQVNRALSKVPGWKSDGSQRRFPKYGKQRVFYRLDEHGKIEHSDFDD